MVEGFRSESVHVGAGFRTSDAGPPVVEFLEYLQHGLGFRV